MRSRPIIAIDGPSGVGKSTVARGLAHELKFDYIDTGALYRAVAMLADQNGVSWEIPSDLVEIIARHRFTFDPQGNLSVNGVKVGDEIRTSHISSGASCIARYREIRTSLLDVQRNIGADGGVVLEGRDIGTVVFKDAEMKFYLTASVATRAARRHAELVAKGETISLQKVEDDQKRRDKTDTEREVSPLKKATDAKEINCDNLNALQVVNLIKSLVVAKFPLTSM